MVLMVWSSRVANFLPSSSGIEDAFTNFPASSFSSLRLRLRLLLLLLPLENWRGVCRRSKQRGTPRQGKREPASISSSSSSSSLLLLLLLLLLPRYFIFGKNGKGMKICDETRHKTKKMKSSLHNLTTTVRHAREEYKCNDRGREDLLIVTIMMMMIIMMMIE